MSTFTFDIFYIHLVCLVKKYENESFSGHFGASVLADEEVALIAQWRDH